MSDTGRDVYKRQAGTLVNAKCVRFEPAAVITEDQIAKVIERMDASLADTRAAMK